MAHRGPPYRTCDLFDQVRVSYSVDAIFPAQCAVQIISVLQYWYNKLTDQSSLSGSAEVRGRKVGVRSHTVLRSFMSNSVSPWFQSYNNKPPIKKNPAFPVPYIRVRKYAKFGIFYANIVQMTPLRLQRESLCLQKFLLTNREPLQLQKFSVTKTVLSLPFLQQIQFALIVNIVNLN